MKGLEMIRKNTRISKEQNDWLNETSKRKGIPVSTLIMMAIEDFMILETRRQAEREAKQNIN